MMKRFIIFLLFLCFTIAGGADDFRHKLTLEEYGRLYGIIRYFSPNPYILDWNEKVWMKFNYQCIRALVEEDEAKALELLHIINPSFTLSLAYFPQKKTVAFNEQYYFREHKGAGEVLVPAFAPRVAKKYKPFDDYLVQCESNTSKNLPQADSIYSFRLSDSCYVNMPLAQRKLDFSYSDVVSLKKSLEKEKKDYDGEKNLFRNFESETYRLADAIARWNIVTHFYPYHEEDNLRWDKYLSVFINEVKSKKYNFEDKDAIYAWYENLRKMFNPLNDNGHLAVMCDAEYSKLLTLYLGSYYLPMRLSTGDDKSFVVDSIVSLKVRKGAKVLKIGGVDVDSLYKYKLSLQNTSRMSSDDNAKEIIIRDVLDEMLSSPSHGKKTSVEFYQDGHTIKDTMIHNLDAPIKNREDLITEMVYIRDSILYCNPILQTPFQNFYKEFKPYLNRQNEYKAVIFDIRGYPDYSFPDVMGHLSHTPLSNFFIHAPLWSFPFREHIRYIAADEVIEPRMPYLDKPRYFLTNYNAMSFAETILIIIKGYNLGTIVGSNSRGTNGDVGFFFFPAFGFRMTAYKVCNVDGSIHHGIGVIPDVFVCPKYGSDVEMDVAKSLIKFNMSNRD